MCFWFLAYVNDLYFTCIININQWAATIFPFSYNYNEIVNNAANRPYMHNKSSFHDISAVHIKKVVFIL